MHASQANLHFYDHNPYIYKKNMQEIIVETLISRACVPKLEL